MSFAWDTLPRPFTALAPLDGVTDVVFRQIISEIGKPDVMFTEFTPVDGFVSNGRERVLHNLLYEPEQKPMIAQIWGTKPENFFKLAEEVKKRGFDGVDINMGCPERTVIKGGACSALIKTPALAAEIIQATKEGAKGIPVSVKTRIGFDTITIEEWIGFLLKQDLAALTVHLRTVREMSKVEAHWELMPKVKQLRDEIAPQTVLLGNGDITSLQEIEEKFGTFGCDGFMVGRGIFANPWMFNPNVRMQDKTPQERIDLYLHHIQLYYDRWGDGKNFASLKKFCKTYISNFPESSEFRVRLMEARSASELMKKLQEFTVSTD